MTKKEIHNGIKKVAATSHYGICLWVNNAQDIGRTYISMGTVKIDSCESDWDAYGMQYGRPQAEASLMKAMDGFFREIYNQLPDREGAQ